MNVNSLFLMYLFTSDGSPYGDSPRTHGASIVERTSWNISSLYFLEFFSQIRLLAPCVQLCSLIHV